MSNKYFLSLLVFAFLQGETSCDRRSLVNVSSECKCGRTATLSTRIVGGRIMGEKDHPSLALVLRNERLYCGGTIINTRYVMTAAHCAKNKWDTQILSVLLGAHSRFDIDNIQTKKYKVGIIKIHQNFRQKSTGGLDNDIALLRLDRTISFSDYIQPICLPIIDTSLYGNNNVQGWGMTQPKGFTSLLPKVASLTLMSPEECLASPTAILMGNPKTHLCAIDDEADTCQGDSGGPMLITTEDGIKIQIGIVSQGISCAKPGYPGIYTRVRAFLPWIYRHTTDSTYCSL